MLRHARCVYTGICRIPADRRVEYLQDGQDSPTNLLLPLQMHVDSKMPFGRARCQNDGALWILLVPATNALKQRGYLRFLAVTTRPATICKFSLRPEAPSCLPRLP